MRSLFYLWSDAIIWARDFARNDVSLYYSHEIKVYEEWTAKVEDVSKANLEKPLLIRNEETSRLTVNFDPEVCM
jgi:hypothetical protein